VWTENYKNFIAFFSKIIAKLTMVISFVLTTNHLHVSLYLPRYCEGEVGEFIVYR
jgi:hypothetical protein